VWFGLVALYENSRVELLIAKEEFEQWWAEAFMTVKKRENTMANKRNTWLSATELENTVRAENRTTIHDLKAKIIEKEAETHFMQKLMDGWSNYQFILSQLSKNSIAEINGSITHQDVDLDPVDD
jgi:hypothetical protein